MDLISGDLLELIKKFISNRLQRILLNWKTYEWEKITTGVTQGLIQL